MKVVLKNKKVLVGLSSVILLGGGLVVANAMNGKTPVNEAVESVAMLSTQVETTLQSEETNEEVKNVEEKQVEEVTTQVQESTQDTKQDTPTVVQHNELKQSQSNTTTQTHQTNSSQVTKPVEQPKQNSNVASVNTPKNNSNNTTTKTNQNNTTTTNHNNTKQNNNSSGNVGTFKEVTKDNTKQAHPDSYYIEKYARDSQGRRVPVFKTIREANAWGYKHMENETWYGLTGFHTQAVVTETGIVIGYYAEMF